MAGAQEALHAGRITRTLAAAPAACPFALGPLAPVMSHLNMWHHPSLALLFVTTHPNRRITPVGHNRLPAKGPHLQRARPNIQPHGLKPCRCSETTTLQS
eukprot:scaffold5192_cov114-Isochrysis_galbana.AAC.4